MDIFSHKFVVKLYCFLKRRIWTKKRPGWPILKVSNLFLIMVFWMTKPWLRWLKKSSTGQRSNLKTLIKTGTGAQLWLLPIHQSLNLYRNFPQKNTLNWFGAFWLPIQNILQPIRAIKIKGCGLNQRRNILYRIGQWHFGFGWCTQVTSYDGRNT